MVTYGLQYRRRDHILSSGHKLVTISEIIWEEDKALEIIQIDIKLVYND
jgi:hypothetical protein